MFAALAKKMFGSNNDRILKGFKARVVQINALEPEMLAMSNEQLAGQTARLRKMLAEGKTLDDLLPEAFATCREASRRAIGQRHFDVQLIGGMALHEGYIPEMRTGEGKTLTATLAVYLNALEGKGVHVVTVNDYLAQRDATWMKPIYESLGMTVGFILTNLTDEMRHASYRCDITYGTNNEFGFDYLRDNMKFSIDQMVQRPFNYAIVDEVDSILVDEARTPLIISGPSQEMPEHYVTVNKIIPLLKEPPPQPEGAKKEKNKDEDQGDYDLDLKNKSVSLTDQGSEHAEEIMVKMGILKEGGLYDAHNITLVHHLNQALRAHKLFRKDVDYIVTNRQVIIIDEFTGRAMEGRRFSDGLHQALEAKEGVPIQNENQTLASTTFQNYFRMYPKLAGMTGTAMTEKDEFEAIYNLRVGEIPTNQAMVRLDQNDEIYRTAAEKYDAIVKVIEDCRARQQPILVGTTSIEKSETLSKYLKQKNIDHQVLNAKYHEQEAYIIAQAGRPGAVTIATNMAGRGTDIKLGGNVEMRLLHDVPQDADAATKKRMEENIRKEVEEAYGVVIRAGGLFVLGSERHESRRIDNQLRGRAGRQGDPGASRFFISLEDDLMRIFGSEIMDKFLTKMGIQKGQAIVHPWINTAIERAQKKVESQHFEMRKHILKFDNVMNDQRKVIYEQRREIMTSEQVSDIIVDMRIETVEALVAAAIPPGTYAEQWDTGLLKSEARKQLSLNIPAEEWVKEEGVDDKVIAERLIAAVTQIYESKVKSAIDQGILDTARLHELEKEVLLRMLDMTWKEHLHGLTYLQQGIQLRGMGQRDPLNEYKQEAFALFQEMLGTLRERVTGVISRAEFHADTPQVPPPRAVQRMQYSRGAEQREPQDTTPVPIGSVKVQKDDPSTWTATRRNDPCPCGSGKKYKYCHGSSQQTA